MLRMLIVSLAYYWRCLSIVTFRGEENAAKDVLPIDIDYFFFLCSLFSAFFFFFFFIFFFFLFRFYSTLIKKEGKGKRKPDRKIKWKWEQKWNNSRGIHVEGREMYDIFLSLPLRLLFATCRFVEFQIRWNLRLPAADSFVTMEGFH